MIELTRAQIDRAVKAAADMSHYCTEDKLMAAAPYLQSPWEPPTDEEVRNSCFTVNYNNTAVKLILDRFINFRNAALIPSPVDPRRETVREKIRLRVFANQGLGKGFTSADIDGLTDDILAGIDKVEA